MSTISVPLTPELEKEVGNLIKSGYGPNKAAVMRRALEHLAEEEAVNAVLQAQKEPVLRGDLRQLAKKIK